MSDQTVGNILRRHGIPPAPDRKKTTTWKEFIRTHREVLVATDFFTTEVRTKGGLVTFYVLFFLISGQLQSPCGWCDALSPSGLDDPEIARNVTMAEWGFLAPGDYLIHDRDSKFCPAFQRTLEETGVKRVVLPARSPNLNAHAERWVRSVKEECLSRVTLFGERALWHALRHYTHHYHLERNHQGKGNVLLLPTTTYSQNRDHLIQCRERLGGLLKYYYREAA